MSNPLSDVLPARVRLAVYAVVFVVGLVLAAWQATEGDWLAFAILLTGSLTSALAGSNTPVRKKVGRITIGSSGFATVQADLVEQGRQIAKALDAYYRDGGEPPHAPRRR